MALKRNSVRARLAVWSASKSDATRRKSQLYISINDCGGGLLNCEMGWIMGGSRSELG